MRDTTISGALVAIRPPPVVATCSTPIDGSFGADTGEGDPISAFTLTTGDYAVLSCDIAAASWLDVAMKGRHAVDTPVANVASFLGGF